MKRGVIMIALLVALPGCTMAPKYARPEGVVPQVWPSGDAYRRQDEAALPDHSWRNVFVDPRLQAVIAQALANNQDVAAAAANIARSRAQYQVQRAQLLPSIDATASLSRGDSGSGERTSASAELASIGYEVDLFGRLQSLSDSARATYLASDSAARATRLALVADIANAWLNYGADVSLLALARQTTEAAEQSRRLVELRYTGGIAARSDLRQAEIALHSAEADVANYTTLVAQDANALRLLAGGDVTHENLPLGIEDADGRIAEVAAGLDSAILLRRPDVLEAEWQLRSANAQIGAARAALFPRISLTGLIGTASNALSGLFSGGTFIWQGGGSASVPMFEGGAGRARVRSSKAQRDAALAGYRKAVQTAFRDVANALARRGTIDAQLAAVRATSLAADDNLKLADLRYAGGIDSYLQDLTARQASYGAARSLVQTRLVAASNRVGLYRALGGDGSL